MAFAIEASVLPFGKQPGPGVSPEPISRSAGHAEAYSGILDGHPGEQPELDHLGRLRVIFGEPGERLIDRDDLIGRGAGNPISLGELDPPSASAVDFGTLVAGIVDQDAAHRLGGGREEMAATVPVPAIFGAHKPQVGLMNQGRGLQRLTGCLVRQIAALRAFSTRCIPREGVVQRPLGHRSRSSKGFESRDSSRLSTWLVVKGNELEVIGLCANDHS